MCSMNMDRWKCRVAVVTGVTSGIGAAICQELVKNGMIVCGLARRKDKIEQLRLSLFGTEGQLNAVECDLTNEDSVKNAYQWIKKTLGGVDLLVNNAGVFSIFGHKVNTVVPGNKPINGMYPACKFALTAITECLRQEFSYVDMSIRVTNIIPGQVENDILTTHGSGDNNELVKYMPRLKPEDVAHAVLFAITVPQNVLIQDVIMKPMGEFL